MIARPHLFPAAFAVSLLLPQMALADQLPGNEDMSGRRELGMAHCPSAVEGARTVVTDLVNGVVVTVSAPDDPLAAEEIRRRVRFQLEIAEEPERGAIEHTGVGTGSGRHGFCPGMLEKTRFDVQWTSDGARMYVRADDDDTIARLQRMTRKRARALSSRRRHLAAGQP